MWALRMLSWALVTFFLAQMSLGQTITAADVQQNISFVGDASISCLGVTSQPCNQQPRLRLTNSFSNQVGAVWFRTPISVTENFTVDFKFMMHTQSHTCPQEHGINEYCVTRGGHGLAFVMHNSTDGLNAIGAGAEGLGYDGIDNGLAWEFDTWFDTHREDIGNNHVSIQASGPDSGLESHHRASLGVSSDVLNLADNLEHRARLHFTPNFRDSLVHPVHCVRDQLCGKMQTRQRLAEMSLAGLTDQGLGTVTVYLDDMSNPLFIVPFNPRTMMRLGQGGTAFVGFTGATGVRQWQIHEVYDWTVCYENSCLSLHDAHES